MENHSEHGEHGPPRGYGPGAHATVGGLSVDADGLRFVPTHTRFTPGEPTEWAFRIVTSTGEVVTAFDEAHGQRGHLIIVRRDLTRFQHLHPRLDEDGTWRTNLFTIPDPGVYRAFFDIVVDGRPSTLGFDLFASGPVQTAPRPSSSYIDTAGDYEVELLVDEGSSDGTISVAFEVRRDDAPVSRLDPYLGSLGHLVALREGDLAYLHVHPEATDPGSGRVEFTAQFPTPGRYRLFLQTKPEGTLVTTQHDVRIEG